MARNFKKLKKKKKIEGNLTLRYPVFSITNYVHKYQRLVGAKLTEEFYHRVNQGNNMGTVKAGWVGDFSPKLPGDMFI
jgi:hypothetical protein